MNRDEYVQKLKNRLDQWNADAARWEKQAEAVKAKQLELFRLRRDEAMYNLKLLENASAAAWKDFSVGCDAAWDSLRDAYGEARKHFEKTTRA
jgi:hypothetical protein